MTCTHLHTGSASVPSVLAKQPLTLTDRDRAATDDLLARILARTVRDEDTGCLVWQGAHNGRGYGRLAVHGRWWLPHRLLFSLLYGDPPAGYEVDHTCHTNACTGGLCVHRRCCEPSHLEAVDPRENFARQLRRIGVEHGACPTCKTPRERWPQA